MPAVRVHRDKFYVGDLLIERVVAALPAIVAKALSTEEKNVFIEVVEKGEFDLNIPALFVDILVKTKPERTANIDERHMEMRTALMHLVPNELLDKGKVGVRIIFAELKFGYI